MALTVSAGHLKQLFAELVAPTPENERVYEAVRIARESRYRVGKDIDGNPVILIETTGQAGAAALLDFVGQHLRVAHGLSCSIREAGIDVGQGQFSVLSCVDADDALKDRFFDAAETLLRSLGELPETGELRRFIAGLIELFRLATQPPIGTIQGLWAELWTIDHARDPKLLLDAWHVEPTDAYDFNSGNQRLEIKSSSHRSRKHSFSHRQLKPPTGSQVVVASLFVENAGGGLKVSELIERIRPRVTDISALNRLDQVVARTLGTSWRAGLESAFDSELAAESLQFFPVERIPSISSEIPIEVTEVRYVSDLAGVPALTVSEMLSRDGLFAAAAPEDP